MLYTNNFFMVLLVRTQIKKRHHPQNLGNFMRDPYCSNGFFVSLHFRSHGSHFCFIIFTRVQPSIYYGTVRIIIII